MKERIHILGASGTGSAPLAITLAEALGYAHFHADDYFWYPTEPPYMRKQPIEQRIQLIKNDLECHEKWILSGSIMEWGDSFIPYLDIVIFLTNSRDNYEESDVIEDIHTRSQQIEKQWVEKLPCTVIYIDSKNSLHEKIKDILHALDKEE